MTTMWQMKPWTIGAIALAMVTGTGCDEGDGDTGDDVAIELVGTWSSGFGDETITKTHWNGFCGQAITRFDNADNVAVLQTLSGDGCGTGYARVVWTDVAADSFHYCVTAFGAETAAAAANAPESGVDRAALDTTGCAGFPWSKLTRK